jgi:subfamily B ATP-binding cassette protein MsbA
MALTKASGEYHEGVVQFMQHYKYLKATGRFPRVQAHLQSIIHRLTQARYRLSLIGGFIHSLPEPIAVILLAVILYVYVVIWQNSFTLVAVLLLLLYRTVMRLMALQSEWNGFFAASGALRVIPETLTAIDRDKEEIGKGKTSGLTEGIELKDVSYAYGEKEALKQVSVQIPKHATIALVGMSGGGKSTLVDILTAVLKPDQGSVTYDGSPYEDLDVEILRQKMGYVTQEITIFNDSILRNVTFWDPETGDQHERVVDACERSQCRGFIEDLPEGYHTHVGDRGINLSVGQRQRIAIARELYRDPEVLIFDEATSALDSESERAIQASIEALKGSKTLVLIAHRLSTIKNADHIYVLDHGRIAEHGTFGELYSNPSSVFRRMCDLQSFDGAGDV